MDKQIIQPSFCLAQPVEDLIPKAIGFNKEELIENVEQMCSFYDNVVYTDDNISELKSNIASLRKLDKALNDERIRVVKVYMQPADSFKSQVDEVRAVIAKRLTAAVAIEREFEEQRLQRKKDIITDIYDANIGEFCDLIPLDKIFNPKWLNVGSSEKAITAEIKKTVDNAKNALITIETLHSPFESRLKAYYFRTLDLGSAILENERLKDEQERIEAMKARQLAREAEIKAQSNDAVQAEVIETVDAPQEQPTEIHERKIKVTLEFELTTDEARALMEYINKNNLAFKRLK